MGQCCHQAPKHCKLADIMLASAALPHAIRMKVWSTLSEANPIYESIKQHWHVGTASALT